MHLHVATQHRESRGSASRGPPYCTRRSAGAARRRPRGPSSRRFQVFAIKRVVSTESVCRQVAHREGVHWWASLQERPRAASLCGRSQLGELARQLQGRHGRHRPRVAVRLQNVADGLQAVRQAQLAAVRVGVQRLQDLRREEGTRVKIPPRGTHEQTRK